jgi:hypothetical protein
MRLAILFLITFALASTLAFAADQTEHDRYADAARAEHKYVVTKNCKPLKPEDAAACRKRADATLNETLKAIRAKYGSGK